jgi:nucleotide-binding universal stress UspA family protein
MLDQDILCATDLTPASDTAVKAAMLLADRVNMNVTLLHVLNKDERTAEGKQKVDLAMRGQIDKAEGTGTMTPKVLEGDFMKVIAEESENGHSMLVLGTHGARGLRQTLFGADILKLVRQAVTPSFVVQDGSAVERIFQHIVLPVAAHSDIDRLLDIVCVLARAFAADVHVYQLMRPLEQPSQELLANKLKMLERLKAEGVRHVEVNTPSTSFSIGFAEPTIRYAEKIGSGCIAIMADASDEYRYIADAEKERLLTNDARIPVLCT